MKFVESVMEKEKSMAQETTRCGDTYQELLERVRRIGSEEPCPVGFSGGRPAAVLIPLIKTDRGAEILFEQRAADLEWQPGEICFPGGGIEEGETPGEAVIRETTEELCVDPAGIRILTGLDVLIGPGGGPVWTYAGCLTGYERTFAENEVAQTFSVPLDWLLSHEPEVYMTRLVTVTGEDFPYELVPGGREYPWKARKNPVYFYRYEDRVIWGFTAHVLTRFLVRIRESGLPEQENR